MADNWFTVDQLREAAGSKQYTDQVRVELAAAVARRKVRSLCGPVSPVETVTERIRVRAPSDALPLKYRPAALTSVTTWAGTVLTLADFTFDEQSLVRVDGGLMADSVTVVYTAGYAEASVPDELVQMAALIGLQLLRVGKRFALNGDATDLAATGFLVPKAALDVAEDYLLAPGGFA